MTAVEAMGAGMRGAHTVATNQAMPRTARARVESPCRAGRLGGPPRRRWASGRTIHDGIAFSAGPERNDGRSDATRTIAVTSPTMTPNAAMPIAGTTPRPASRSQRRATPAAVGSGRTTGGPDTPSRLAGGDQSQASSRLACRTGRVGTVLSRRRHGAPRPARLGRCAGELTAGAALARDLAPRVADAHEAEHAAHRDERGRDADAGVEGADRRVLHGRGDHRAVRAGHGGRLDAAERAALGVLHDAVRGGR